MGIHEKVSEYKSLCYQLDKHYKAIEYIFVNETGGDIEEIHMQCLKTQKEIEKCYQEICEIRKKQQN